MVRLQKITSANSEAYNYVEQLLTKSFPIEEYRPLNDWKAYTDKNVLFQNNIILDNNNPVGLMTIWDLDKFYYIEHFAIDENLRGAGYGSKVLDCLEQKAGDKPIILEVELPEDSTAKRRIEFYKKYNFNLWLSDYQQPPYRPTEPMLPLLIMCRGNLNEKEHFKEVVQLLHKNVYRTNK